MTRSLSFAVLALAVSACEPDLPKTPTPTVVTAVFDPSNSKIPLPNDLAFLSTATQVCGGAESCAQAELLATLRGAFPSDQTVAITIDFTQIGTTGGKTVTSAPDLDLATVVTTDTATATVMVLSVGTGAPGVVALAPVTAADYTDGGDHGTLTLHNKDLATWPKGSYIVAVRGGANGIKTKDQLPVYPAEVFHLLKQGKDMSLPENLGLLCAQAGSYDAALALGKQLNTLQALIFTPTFKVIDTKFPHDELAVAATFKIGDVVTNVTIDPARGLAPLPIDLLRDPTSGKLTAVAACSLAGSTLGPDGKCLSAAAAGFQSLDGFSTTGSILARTSDLIAASTVTGGTFGTGAGASVLLFELSKTGGAPTRVLPETLLIEPCEVTSSAGTCDPAAQGLSQAVVIAPVGFTSGNRTGDRTAAFRTKPLKENTDYAVGMTTDLLDKAGKPIGPGTVAKIVRFSNPLVVNGKSALQGIDDTTAASLEKMRLQLQPVFTALAAGGIDKTKVAMAYTFHTQTITTPAVQLAALPYTKEAGTAAPGVVAPPEDAATVFTRFGVPTSAPSENISKILSTTITTFNALDPASGAFLADPTKAVAETINVMIAVPMANNANIPACPAPLDQLRCAPMMVFRHGLGGGRADMLAVADRFAAAGLVTVAIDAAKHGDRSFCTSGQTGQAAGCNDGVACMTALPAGAQGDAKPPGKCADGKLLKHAVGSETPSEEGIPFVSGNYLISANLFRTRDTLRQDLIDESQLIRAIAFVPSAGASNSVFTAMATLGVVIDPSKIYYTGQSLGAIQGAMNVASNPRLSKAGFNVGGGTLVDVFTSSMFPKFQTKVNDLLVSLGITKGTAQYLQFLTVAKTVLDPADPVNFVGHLTGLPGSGPMLPDLLKDPSGGMLQAPKTILNQMANCDEVVPFFTGYLYASNTGSTPVPPTGAAGTFELFASSVPPKACGENITDVPHTFLTDWANVDRTKKAQDDIAAFVKSDTLPASLQQQ